MREVLCDIKIHMHAHTILDITTDALRYWERRRLIYNAVLATIVIGYFAAGLPRTAAAVTLDRLLGLFALAVLANVAYCAAYIPDVFAQLSSFGTQWRRYRPVLFVIGSGLGAVIARAIVTGELAGR